MALLRRKSPPCKAFLGKCQMKLTLSFGHAVMKTVVLLGLTPSVFDILTKQYSDITRHKRHKTHLLTLVRKFFFHLRKILEL